MSEQTPEPDTGGLFRPCQDCGYPFAQPAGACHLCPECGSSSGCS